MSGCINSQQPHNVDGASALQATAPAIAGHRSVANNSNSTTGLVKVVGQGLSASLSKSNATQRTVTSAASPISINLENCMDSNGNFTKSGIETFAIQINTLQLDQADKLPQIFDTLAQKGNAESNFGDLLAKVNNYNDKLEIIKYLDSNKETKDLANKLFQGLDAYTQARILRLLTTENYNKTNETKDDGAQLATNLVKAEKNANPEIINDIKGKLESIQQDNTLSKIANFSETCNNLLIGINNVTNTSLKGNEQVITKYTPPSAGESESKAEGQQQVGNAASTNSKVDNTSQENPTKVEGQEPKVVEQESTTKSISEVKKEGVHPQSFGDRAQQLNGIDKKTNSTAPQAAADSQSNEKEMVEKQNVGAIKMLRDVETQKYMENAVGNDLPQQKPSPSSLTVATQKQNFLNSPAPKLPTTIDPYSLVQKLGPAPKPLKKQQLPNFPAPPSPLEILKSNTSIDEILKNLTLNHIIQSIDDEKNETNFQTLNKLHTIITKFLQDQNKTTELSDDLILKLIKKQDAVYEQLKKLINTNTDIKQTIEISNNQTLPYFNERILNLLINNPKEKNDLITFLEGIKNYCNDQTVKDTLAKDQDLQSTTNKLLDNIENVLKDLTSQTVPPPPAIGGPKPPQHQNLPPPLPRQQHQPSAEGKGIPPEELPPPPVANGADGPPLATAPSGRAGLLSQIQQGTNLRRVERAPAELPKGENARDLMSILKNVVPVIQTEQTETNPDDTISEAEWNDLQKDDIPNISNFSVNQRPQPQPATGPTASKGQQPQFQPVARTRPSAPPHSDDLATQKTKDENQQLLRKALTTRRSAIADDQVDNETTEPFSY